MIVTAFKTTLWRGPSLPLLAASIADAPLELEISKKCISSHSQHLRMLLVAISRLAAFFSQKAFISHQGFFSLTNNNRTTTSAIDRNSPTPRLPPSTTTPAAITFMHRCQNCPQFNILTAAELVSKKLCVQLSIECAASRANKRSNYVASIGSLICHHNYSSCSVGSCLLEFSKKAI